MASANPPSGAPEGPTTISCSISDSFAAWLAQADGSIVVSTYQAGKVAVIGWDGRQVTLLMRQFEKPLGLALDGPRMALATRHDVTFFADAPLLAPDFFPDQRGRYDALYAPRASYHTGDLNVHDVAFGKSGLWIVASRFCCLAKLSHDYSFVPQWKPPFVSEIVPEDRCHLNGLAMVDGEPKYLTALGETDSPGAWREKKATGGVVLDYPSGEVVLRGLAMPHSPRWYKNQLWVLNSGLGELWVVDPQNQRHAVVCALPAYLRGLAFAGPFALIGMCQIREKHIFGNLPVQQRGNLLCGVAVVDLRNGQVAGMLEFTAGCQEIYDIQFLPGKRKVMIVNSERPEAKQAFTAPEFSYWLRPANELPIK